MGTCSVVKSKPTAQPGCSWLQVIALLTIRDMSTSITAWIKKVWWSQMAISMVLIFSELA